MELVLENRQRMYIDECVEGATARLYGEDGVLVDQMEFSAEFLFGSLFGNMCGGGEE